MEIKKIITTTQLLNIDVDEVTLLSIDEYNAYKSAIPPIRCWWWLRSPSYYHQHYVADVNNDGYVDKDGDSVRNDFDGVRPALKLSNHSLNVGDTFETNGTVFTVISQNLAITNNIIGHHRFNTESNDYETSEIKDFIEKWWEELNGNQW